MKTGAELFIFIMLVVVLSLAMIFAVKYEQMKFNAYRIIIEGCKQ